MQFAGSIGLTMGGKTMALDAHQSLLGIEAGVTVTLARTSEPGVMSPAPNANIANVSATARTARCTCGSGRRYKHCCGQLAADTVSANSVVWQPDFETSILFSARRFLQVGEADKAAEVLQRLRPHEMQRPASAREAGEMCLDLHLLELAVALLQRSLELDDNNAYGAALLHECRRLMELPHAWQIAAGQLRAAFDRMNALADPIEGVRRVHIVSKLDTIGGTESRALCLWRVLSRHVPTTLWSTEPPHAAYADYPIRRISAAEAPQRGTLALIGTYFDCGDWLQHRDFARVVICHNLAEQHESLAKRFAQIEENPSHPEVRLIFPSNLFREISGLPGLVEYSSIDVEAFRRTRAVHSGRCLTVGRHGRAQALKFHPNDPVLFRALSERGHRVRVLGGTPIASFFAGQTDHVPELLPVGSEAANRFLDDLDVFIYRKHPQLVETGGTVILEAMAMSLPVIVFADRCGNAELIVDGVNGFLVETEEAALELVDALSRDPARRERIGVAARATIEQLVRDQEAQVVAQYTS